MGLAPTPQAGPPHRRRRPHLVGSPGQGLVDRRRCSPWARASSPSAPSRATPACRRGPDRLDHLLRGLDLLHLGRASSSTASRWTPERTIRPHGWRKVFVYRPRQIDWWASGIQLIGTIYFNASTGNAVRIDLSAQAALQHVWRPDAVGSICFLVASGLAWFEVCHGWAAWSPASLDWWITALNLVGSVAFGVSAVAAFVVPSTGQLWHAQLSNLGHLRRRPVLPRRRPAPDAGADGRSGAAGGPDPGGVGRGH